MDRIPWIPRIFHTTRPRPRAEMHRVVSLTFMACLILPSILFGRGWLGVSVQDITPELREAMALEARAGALVSDVSEGGPAEKAGIEPRDVIVRMDGVPVEDTSDLLAALGAKSPSDRVRISVLRGTGEMTFDATLGEREKEPPVVDDETVERELRLHPEPGTGRPEWNWVPKSLDALGLAIPRRGQLGVSVHSLDADLAPYFDARAGEGVVVLRVQPDSPADRAGVRGGDILLEINRDKIRSPEGLRRAVADMRPGDDWVIRGRRHGEPIEFRGRTERNSDWPSEQGRYDRPPLARDRVPPEQWDRDRILRRLERTVERLQERIEDLERRLERGGRR